MHNDKDIGEYTYWAIFWSLVTVIILIITSAVTFLIYESQLSEERIIRELKIDPLVYKCVNKGLASTSNFIVCSKLIDKLELTDKERKYLMENFENK